MQLKKIKIAHVATENNIFLAPLAGYTNSVFRETCFNLGAGLTFTEMVSAKGLAYGNEKTEDLLAVTEAYSGVKACQIFGAEPKFMRAACESEALAPFDIVDINMGCPVPKIYKNGEGSALLNDIPLAERIISECKKSGKIITVKFRIGIDGEHIRTEEFAKACENAGADMITVHGRTRDKMYSGEVNFKEIAKAKNAVKIPVIANGGVFDKADAEKLMSETGADGIMVARGAMFNPFVFAEITGKPVADKREVIRRQLNDTFASFDERFATVYMRKMLSFYIKGARGAARIKERLFKCANKNEIEEVLNILEF